MDPETKKPLEEPSVTMVDVLQEERELEEEYNAVLGASDENCCTYSRGSIKRQALYSCLTCCPDALTDLDKCAGICLACSYRCHENHELVELYTKRNFRCDCPTERFAGQHRCLLNSEMTALQVRNSENVYNQNFQGLYCKCRRPYPDPERTTEEVMLQCTVCEDWFHVHHLDAPASAAKIAETDVCGEMICCDCMQKHTFLQDYTGLALQMPDDPDVSVANVKVVADTSLCEENDNKLHSDLDKSISDIMNMTEIKTAASVENGKSSCEPSEDVEKCTEDICSKSKRRKIENDQEFNEQTEEQCRRPRRKQEYPGVPQCDNRTRQRFHDSRFYVTETTQIFIRPRTATPAAFPVCPTFWTNDWRAALCQCSQCLALYKSEKVDYLLDTEDSAKSYEERGKQRGATESTYEQGIRALASIGRVQQIDAITEYNRMKDKLKEYLQTFAVTKKVVTEADINRFFTEMRNEKNAGIGQPHFCR